MAEPAEEAAGEARRILRPLRRELVELVQRLVQANSVNTPPNGHEATAQRVLEEFYRSKGIEADVYATEFLRESRHRYARPERNLHNRKNLSVRLNGAGRGRSLLLNGHIDTVPPGRGNWSVSPWSGCLRGSRIYGLGSFDMKAGIAAHAAVIAALYMSGTRLQGDLMAESVVDEEWGGGSGTLAARLRNGGADAGVVSEGTQLQILRATRGGYVVDLHVQAGDSSAYFSHGEIVSPAVPLGRLLGWVDTWIECRGAIVGTGAYASVPNPAPVQVLAVESNRLESDVPLSVPTTGSVRIYFQFLPDEDVPAILDAIKASLKAFESSDPFFRSHPVQWRPLYDPALLGHELSIDHPWTKCLAESVEAIRHKPPTVSAAPYPCDAFLMQREFGIPTLLFGPCGAGAHNPDEYVDVKSTVGTAETLLTAALIWCS
jgi:acetylornithine deacetylase